MQNIEPAISREPHFSLKATFVENKVYVKLPAVEENHSTNRSISETYGLS